MEEKNYNKTVYYTNQVQVQGGIYDFALTFTNKHQEDDKEVACVVMSPQHAKVLAHMLVESIVNYEKEIGQIDISGLIEENTEAKNAE